MHFFIQAAIEGNFWTALILTVAGGVATGGLVALAVWLVVKDR